MFLPLTSNSEPGCTPMSCGFDQLAIGVQPACR